MSNGPLLSLKELENASPTRGKISGLLIEQAAAYLGRRGRRAQHGRIAQQNEELERLQKMRDTLLKKK